MNYYSYQRSILNIFPNLQILLLFYVKLKKNVNFATYISRHCLRNLYIYFPSTLFGCKLKTVIVIKVPQSNLPAKWSIWLKNLSSCLQALLTILACQLLLLFHQFHTINLSSTVSTLSLKKRRGKKTVFHLKFPILMYFTINEDS